MGQKSFFASVRGLVRAVRAERRFGRSPQAIVLSPELNQRLKDRAFGNLWTDREQTELLGLPVRIDPGAAGWSFAAES